MPPYLSTSPDNLDSTLTGCQVVVSRPVANIAEFLLKKCQLRPYRSRDQACVFFGCHNVAELNLIRKHHGRC